MPTCETSSWHWRLVACMPPVQPIVLMHFTLCICYWPRCCQTEMRRCHNNKGQESGSRMDEWQVVFGSAAPAIFRMCWLPFVSLILFITSLCCGFWLGSRVAKPEFCTPSLSPTLSHLSASVGSKDLQPTTSSHLHLETIATSAKHQTFSELAHMRAWCSTGNLSIVWRDPKGWDVECKMRPVGCWLLAWPFLIEPGLLLVFGYAASTFWLRAQFWTGFPAFMLSWRFFRLPLPLLG